MAFTAGACKRGTLTNGESSDQITDSRKQKVPGIGPALVFVAESGIGLVTVVIVIMVVPVAIRTPTVPVFIPPAMAVFPAPGAGFGQFMAIPRGLRAVPTMMLCGFVKFVVRAGDAPLAVVAIRSQRSGAREQQCGP